jgi:hypothetical protein
VGAHTIYLVPEFFCFKMVLPVTKAVPSIEMGRNESPTVNKNALYRQQYVSGFQLMLVYILIPISEYPFPP